MTLSPCRTVLGLSGTFVAKIVTEMSLGTAVTPPARVYWSSTSAARSGGFENSKRGGGDRVYVAVDPDIDGITRKELIEVVAVGRAIFRSIRPGPTAHRRRVMGNDDGLAGVRYRQLASEPESRFPVDVVQLIRSQWARRAADLQIVVHLKFRLFHHGAVAAIVVSPQGGAEKPYAVEFQGLIFK